MKKKVKSNSKKTREDFLSLQLKKLPNYMVWVIILLLCLIAVFIFEFLILPSITLKGNKYVQIDYLEKYKEKGYSAEFMGNDITKDVNVSGKIDNKKLGKYKIKYSVKSGTFHRNVYRYVTVGDYTKPVIDTIKGDVYICPGKKFKSLDVKASDNYDGDITKNVKEVISKSKVTYTVSDKHHNTAVVTKKIKYEDNTVPEVKLNGNETLYYYIGDTYNESGVSATDNCDGDLTENVKITGKVDTNAAGEYKIRYEVKDKSGNSTTIERKVIVSKRDANGTIYLTFDDGPKSGTTDVILDILKEEGVKATFFVTNSGPDELIKREYDEGHSIALHTASHNYSYVYSSVDNYFSDLMTVSNRVKNITGYESKLIRFPGGSSNTVSRKYSEGIMSTLVNEVQNRGFRYYDWNLSSGDAEAGGHTGEEIFNNVKSRLRKDRVNMVLMHDIKPYTRDALRKIIQYGKENGYTFDKIDVTTEMVTQRVNN